MSDFRSIIERSSRKRLNMIWIIIQRLTDGKTDFFTIRETRDDRYKEKFNLTSDEDDLQLHDFFLDFTDKNHRTREYWTNFELFHYEQYDILFALS